MSRYLDELEQELPASGEAYKSERRAQLVVERLCQIAIECAIDTNTLLITAYREGICSEQSPNLQTP